MTITKEQILMISRNLETMGEVFIEKQLLFSALERERFFEAKNRITLILSKVYPATPGGEAL